MARAQSPAAEDGDDFDDQDHDHQQFQNEATSFAKFVDHKLVEIAGGVAAPNTSVFGVSRSTDHLDVFAVGTDHGIYTAAWLPGWSSWQGWWPIAGGVAAPGTSVFGVSRSTDHLDVFAIGTDHGIYTAAWQPGFTGWHGWWRVAGGVAEGG